MSSTQIQPPPSPPKRLRNRSPPPRLTPITPPLSTEPTTSTPPPTLAALVASSEPDSPPLHPALPAPETLCELEDMLYNTSLLISAFAGGHACPELHPELVAVPVGVPLAYYLAFAGREEMRVLERLAVAEGKLLACKVRRQEEEMAWWRGEVLRGVGREGEESEDDGDEDEDGGVKVELEDDGDVKMVMGTEEVFGAGTSDHEVVRQVKVKLEAKKDGEARQRQDDEATSAFFEVPSRSVLPVAVSAAEFYPANCCQRSLVRRNRPHPLDLSQAMSMSAMYSLANQVSSTSTAYTQSAAGSSVEDPRPSALDILAMIRNRVAQGGREGTLILPDDTTGAPRYVNVNWTLATPDPRPHPESIVEDLQSWKSSESSHSEQLTLQSMANDDSWWQTYYGIDPAIISQSCPSVEGHTALPYQFAGLDSKMLAQKGFQQWAAAQAAFQLSHYSNGAPRTPPPALSPDSEELARRGREQWWMAQTAHHCRMRAERYRLKDELDMCTSMAGPDGLTGKLPG